MLMRLRLPELLTARGLTAYQVVQASEGRISTSTAYRVVRNRGRAKSFDAAFLEALCDVLDVGPGELLERDADARPTPPSGKPARTKGKPRRSPSSP
jgi:DNA-binding Xre family transcriptional regulator